MEKQSKEVIAFKNETAKLLNEAKGQTKNEVIKDFVDSLDCEARDAIYRHIWSKRVREDVENHLENMDETLTDDEIRTVAERYVYQGAYDCNLNYWTNIENLITELIRDRK
jgi:hypothetical protein